MPNAYWAGVARFAAGVVADGQHPRLPALGIAKPSQPLDARGTGALEALAVAGLESIWIFSRVDGRNSLANAKGAHIAVGPDAASTAVAAKLLLKHAGPKPDDVRLSSLAGVAAAQALAEGRVDMVFQVAGVDSLAVQMLTHMEGVQLSSVYKAASLAS